MSAVTASNNSLTEEWRICSQCWERRPLSDFRFRFKSKGERHPQCRHCNTEGARRRAARKREQQIHDFTSRLIKERNARKLAVLVGEMVQQFGGVESFAKAWHAAIESARARGKDCSALRSFRALFQLMTAREELELEAKTAFDQELEQMGSEEIREMRLRGAVELIREQPQIAIQAAMRLGWSVTPPDEVQR
ncbi:MAG: hypothetical protein R3C02_07660 [Planctomycetaceae bacterium]